MEDILSEIKEQQDRYFRALDNYCPEYKELVYDSQSRKSDNIKLQIFQEKFVGDLDFDIEIENLGQKSEIWFSSALNHPNSLWRFLEALILIEDEYCCYIEEEGPDTFLYAQTINDDTIRVLHISDRVQCQRFIQSEDYKIRQDFIIDRKIFIKCLYDELMRVISNSKRDDIYDYMQDEYDDLFFDSEIIKGFINM